VEPDIEAVTARVSESDGRAYHLHTPWAIPTTLFDSFIVAYPAKRYRSAWIGIAVHSAQSVFLAILIFTLVV
jgi:hypothetical protein